VKAVFRLGQGSRVEHSGYLKRGRLGPTKSIFATSRPVFKEVKEQKFL